MLKVTTPRPSLDAVLRGDGRGPFQPAFEDDPEPPFKRLTRAEAEALQARQPTLSPWRVVGAQVALGALAAALAWLATGAWNVAASALYGAAVVAVPGALMARGATSPLSAISPLSSAVSLLGWGFVKLAVTVAMLVLAPRVVESLSWPVLLAVLVVCMQTYWLALLWRPAATNGNGI